jgi:hypothetical protein
MKTFPDSFQKFLYLNSLLMLHFPKFKSLDSLDPRTLAIQVTGIGEKADKSPLKVDGGNTCDLVVGGVFLCGFYIAYDKNYLVFNYVGFISGNQLGLLPNLAA